MRLYTHTHTHTHTHTYNLDNERGITLVALVVTIVVLLILAAVSINLVLGENGLISNAKEARNKTLEAEKTEGESLNNVEHYIKQTAGVTASGITADDYGKVVTNYNADGKTWKIFYSDSNNVYIITKENCAEQKILVNVDENSGYNGTSDFDGSENFKNKYPAIQAGWLNKTYTPSASVAGTVNYTSSYNNMKCTEYLLDSSIWNEKYKTEKADWAIGAPTLELFVASYNKKFTDKKVILDKPSGTGYENPLPEEKSWPENDNLYNKGYFYWLACPSNDGTGMWRIFASYIVNAEYKAVDGIRPVVCLNSSITLIESADGNTFSIK